jgi:2-methylcitrate dehydratase PrpD
MNGGPSLTERLAPHLLRPVDGNVQTKARLHLLDWLACVAGARRSPMGEIQARFDDQSTVMRAAFLGNVLEMDDVHRAAILHPGPVVWPTVLGDADAGMEAVLTAAVRGYEAMIAIGATFDARHYAHWHTTATAGVFGAAAAVASLFDCDEEETVSALGLAGSVTGGFWQMRHEPVLAKQWHIAHALQTGASAAFFAAHGVTGPRFILEGPQGLYAATCATPRPLELGEGWRIDEVSFKPWGACRHAHPAIDAALELKAQGGLRGPVTVETFRDALAFCDRPDPKTVIDAKFSLQHAVAVVMARGVPMLADFEPDAIAALAPLRAQVSVAEDPTITARYPAHFGARVTATGGAVELVDTRGDPERPIGEAGVIEKARALFAWGGLSDDQAEQGISLALDGDDAEAVVAWLDELL